MKMLIKDSDGAARLVFPQQPGLEEKGAGNVLPLQARSSVLSMQRR
jgi:hypothetical protein